MAAGGPPRRLYDSCAKVVMRPGDTLYMPAGQVHMAWSTPDTDSLHVTIGIQRGGPQTGFSSQTWARLVQSTASTLKQQPPYEALAAHPRLHRIPRALAAGALQRPAFAEDLLWEELLGSMLGEYAEEIAPLLAPTVRQLGPSEALDATLRDAGNLRAWVTKRLYQTAFSAMPVGLLHDPTTFPEHSAGSRGYNEARENSMYRPPLTDALTASTFQRDGDALAILQPERSGDGYMYRLLQYRSFKHDEDEPSSAVIDMIDSVLASDNAVDPSEDERLASHNLRVPAALVGTHAHTHLSLVSREVASLTYCLCFSAGAGQVDAWEQHGRGTAAIYAGGGGGSDPRAG